MPLQLSAEPLQFTASQHGPAVLALQLVLLLHHLEQLLLQNLQLLLIAPMLLQLQGKHTHTSPLSVKIQHVQFSYISALTSSACFLMMASSFCSGVWSLFRLCMSSMASLPEQPQRLELSIARQSSLISARARGESDPTFSGFERSLYKEKSFWHPSQLKPTIKGMWKYYFTCSSVADGCTYTHYSSAYTPIGFSTTWTFADGAE